MPILVTPNGLEILAFLPSPSPDIPPEDHHIPLTWSVVAAWCGEGYVFAYNHTRLQWELPGGGIEHGETPAEAAIRELEEESSQITTWVDCRGVFKIRLQSDGRYEYGALYYTELDGLREFIPNAETSQLTTCHPDHDTEQITTPFSRWLIQMAQG